LSAVADIVAFWGEKWFGGDGEFDRPCRQRFREAHVAAAARKFGEGPRALSQLRH
jgi:uncharacterized protein (DUF924 family)